MGRFRTRCKQLGGPRQTKDYSKAADLTSESYCTSSPATQSDSSQKDRFRVCPIPSHISSSTETILTLTSTHPGTRVYQESPKKKPVRTESVKWLANDQFQGKWKRKNKTKQNKTKNSGTIYQQKQRWSFTAIVCKTKCSSEILCSQIHDNSNVNDKWGECATSENEIS